MKAIIENIGTDYEKVLQLHTKTYTYSHVEISVETGNGIMPVDQLDEFTLRRLIYDGQCDIKSTITFDNKKRDWVEVPVLKDNNVIIQLRHV